MLIKGDRNMGYSRRGGQISVEFVIIVAFVILVTVAFLFLLQQRVVDANKVRDEKAVKDLQTVITDEIKAAKRANDGYLRVFNISKEVSGKRYAMQIENDATLLINYSNHSYVSDIPADVKGHIIQDSDSYYEIRLNKTGGKLYVNGS